MCFEKWKEKFLANKKYWLAPFVILLLLILLAIINELTGQSLYPMF